MEMTTAIDTLKIVFLCGLQHDVISDVESGIRYACSRDHLWVVHIIRFLADVRVRYTSVTSVRRRRSARVRL
jgi:hypothetical protein